MKKFAFYFLIAFVNFYYPVFSQWEACNNGLWSGDIDSFIIDGQNIYAGGAVNGVFMTTDNGDHWVAKKNNGLKGFKDINITTLAISGNNIFAGTFLDGIFLSTDKGENWVLKSNGLPYIPVSLSDSSFDVVIWAILINGNSIFAGTDKGVYISTDNGENWTDKNNGLPQFDSFRMDVNALAISGNYIYAGTDYGVYLSTDNGDNWTAKNNGLPISDTLRRVICSMAISGNNIFVGTAWGGIYLSTNNGENWKYLGFYDIIISAIIIKENNIFAAGGFYISSDNGVNWTTHESGLISRLIDCLIINGDYIFAGIDAYGVYRAKLSDLGIIDVKETEQKNENIIYLNPTSTQLFVQQAQDINSKYEIINLLGIEVLSGEIQGRRTTINIAQLPQGLYFIRIGEETRKFLKE
jgi:photosystem II stability/assembly factor-like uncharacterized protein